MSAIANGTPSRPLCIGSAREGSAAGYTASMSTVSERLREEDRERLLRMTPLERLTEALALGDAAIEAYAVAHGTDREEARRRFERAAHAGRRPSAVMKRVVS